MKTVLVLAASSVVLLLAAPASSRADRIYTYTGNPLGSGVQIEVSSDTSLTDAQLDNLPAGTDMSASLLSSSLTTLPPSQDNADFPVADHSLTGLLSTFEIGTDGLGNITSWDIGTLQLFASSLRTPPFPAKIQTSFSAPTMCLRGRVAIV